MIRVRWMRGKFHYHPLQQQPASQDRTTNSPSQSTLTRPSRTLRQCSHTSQSLSNLLAIPDTHTSVRPRRLFGASPKMSKINAKNLQYNTSLPPFLARLRGEQAARDFDGPDPILAAQRRPTKPGRTGSEEAEDAPLVVDEHGHAVDGAVVQVGKDGTVTAAPGPESSEPEQKDTSRATEEKENAAATAAGRKKRKVGKVIGAHDGDEDDDNDEKDPKAGRVKEQKKQKTTAEAGTTKEGKDIAASATAAAAASKTNKGTKKKTAKKIKLSFGEEDEG
ncbi:hypothetical protein B0H63DRAFT_253915 [Podospora didyma]|uniref:DUF4604 domain-containing protein n=1 Tax=Podospora didyma TaxID=330526 RepID=A0AAE0KEP4_9PEZI|nr:hypothetical protein B0H63DRAFT_253915 [Podospora didyma]